MGRAGTSYYICYTFNFLLACFTTSSFSLSCIFFCFCFLLYTELSSFRKPPWGSSFLLSSSFPYILSVKITQPMSLTCSYAQIHHEFITNLLFHTVNKTATLLPTAAKSLLCISIPGLLERVLHWRISLFSSLFAPPAADSLQHFQCIGIRSHM